VATGRNGKKRSAFSPATPLIEAVANLKPLEVSDTQHSKQKVDPKKQHAYE
jgi:hypothetical protein